MGSSCIAGLGGVFGAMIVLGGVILTIFWVVCAWRAMRAHEKLAESVQELCRKQSASDNP